MARWLNSILRKQIDYLTKDKEIVNAKATAKVAEAVIGELRILL